MKFSNDELKRLENNIKDKMSTHRYTHTLGVCDAAKKIASYCYAGDVSEIIAAALLHDISKEYSTAEQFDIIRRYDIKLTDTDMMSEPVLHSFTAPYVIMNDFNIFSTTNILSSVYNHTTGSPDMSLFDEIIFVADYRKFLNCVKVREKLYDDLKSSQDIDECISHLHNATISALELTIIELIKNGKVLNERTVATRNAFLSRVPMPLN